MNTRATPTRLRRVVALVALGALGVLMLAVANGTAASTAFRRGGTITVLSAGDVDHIDPGQAYYSFSYEITFATQRPLLAYKPGSVNAVPDLAASMPSKGRQDGHRAHPARREVRPARQPGGDIGRRQVRDRATLLDQRRKRLRRRLLRRRGRRSCECDPEGAGHQGHPDS